MTSIAIARVQSPEAADFFKLRFTGCQTYFDFQVGLAPVGGEFEVLVETDYPASAEEIRSHLISLMFQELAGLCREKARVSSMFHELTARCRDTAQGAPRKGTRK